MNKKSLLKHLVFMMFFIFLANFLILKFYWYSLIWYLDIVMHFLGGFWVGLFFLYVFFRKEQPSFTSGLFFKLLFITLLVGLLWELYEFLLNIIAITPFNLNDTISDIFSSLLGSTVSVFYFLKIIMSAPLNKVQLKNEPQS